MTNVDDIWAQMQADAVPSQQPKPTKRKKKQTPPAAAAKDAQGSKSNEEDWEVVGGDARSLQRDINTIGDGESTRVERLRSMEAIYHQIQLATKGEPEAGQAVWDLCLKPLVKRLYDDAEKIRILALESLLEGFVLTDDVLEATPYVLPVMVDRMVIAEHFQFEPSEEGRLRLIRLLRHLLDLRPKALMAEHSQEVLTIVVAATKDGAPEVKKVALSCVRPITLTVAHYSIWKQETIMVMEACGATLGHRHASVRLAGLDAIDALMQLGGAAEPLQAVAGDQIRPQTWGDVFSEDVKNNFLAMMIQDGNPSVRQAYFQYLGAWLAKLEDKMDHEHLLAPYLLSGLSDNSIAIREATIDAISEVGARYELDNALEFREEIEYGLLKHEDQRFMQTTGPLPKPMKGRPRLGSRVFVRSHAYRMIPAIIRELKEPLFTETVRLRSATLLRIVLAYLEEHATKFTRNFIDAFMNTLHLTKDDPDPVLIETLLGCATLLGRFVDVHIYLPFIQLDTVLGSSNPAGSILLAAAILKGMPPSAVAEHAMSFMDQFVPHDICESNDFHVQLAVLSLLESVVERYTKTTQDDAVVLSYTMAHVEVGLSIGSHSDDVKVRVVACRAGLQALLGFEESVYHQLVLNTILRRFDAGDLSVLSPRGPMVLCHGIEEASVPCVETNVGIIMRLISPSAQPKKPPESLPRCLRVASKLIAKLGPDERVMAFLGSTLRFLKHVGEEGLAILLECTETILLSAVQSEDEIHFAKRVLRAALKSKELAVSSEANALVKRNALAKECSEGDGEDEEEDEEEEEEEEVIEVDVSMRKAASGNQPVEDCLKDCTIGVEQPRKTPQQPYQGIEIEEIQDDDQEPDSMLEELD